MWFMPATPVTTSTPTAGPRPLRRPHRRRRATSLPLIAPLLLVLAALAAGCTAEAPPQAVHVLAADITVGGVLERYLDRGIDRAERDEAAAVVVLVNSPGGSIDAMRDIVSRIEQAELPVITFVSPPGAQAASAATFITMAGHLAAMAPNTTIGAATPITATGEDIEGALGRKVENDTVAFARGVAELRGRNADWAEAAVREAVSASAQEAAALGVVDLLVPSLPALLREADGRTVELLSGREVTLALADAELFFNDRNLYERVLEIISDPVVVSLLVLIGLAGLAIEFLNPGLFLPGVVGVTATVASFLGIGTLLPGEAALVFLGLGLALLVLEAFVPSGGILGSGGAVSIVLGLSILVGQGSTDLDVRRVLLFVAVVVLAVLAVTAFGLALLTRGYLSQTEPGDPSP